MKTYLSRDAELFLRYNVIMTNGFITITLDAKTHEFFAVSFFKVQNKCDFPKNQFILVEPSEKIVKIAREFYHYAQKTDHIYGENDASPREKIASINQN